MIAIVFSGLLAGYTQAQESYLMDIELPGDVGFPQYPANKVKSLGATGYLTQQFNVITYFNSCQQPVWARKVQNIRHRWQYDLIQVNDSQFYEVLRSARYNGPVVFKFNIKGKILWRKVLDFGPQVRARNYQTDITYDGGLVMIVEGEKRGGNYADFKSLIKLNADGTLAWKNDIRLDTAGGNTFFNRDLERIQKGKYVALFDRMGQSIYDNILVFFNDSGGRVTRIKTYFGSDPQDVVKVDDIEPGKKALYGSGSINPLFGHAYFELLFKLGSNYADFKWVRLGSKHYGPDELESDLLKKPGRPLTVLYNNGNLRRFSSEGKLIGNWQIPTFYYYFLFDDFFDITADSSLLLPAFQPRGNTDQTVLLKTDLRSSGGCLKRPDTFVRDTVALTSKSLKNYYKVLSKPMQVRKSQVTWKPVEVSRHMVCTRGLYPKAQLGPDTVICYDSTFTLSPGPDTSILDYQWNTGDTIPTLTVDTSGIYKVTVSGDSCTNRDSIRVTFLYTHSAGLRSDTTVCSYDSIQLRVRATGAKYRWQPAGIDSFQNGQSIDSLRKWVQEPGTYRLYLDSIDQCPLDTFQLSKYHPPKTPFKADTICSYDSVLLEPGANAHFVWQLPGRDSLGKKSRVWTGDSGRYVLWDTLHGCRADTFRLSKPGFQGSIPESDTVCPYDSFRITVQGSHKANLGWSLPSRDTPFIKKQVIWASDTGAYHLWETRHGCVLDTFTLSHHHLPPADAGPDTLLCYNQEYIMQGDGGVKYHWIPATYLSSDTIPDPKAKLPEKQSYILIVSNREGCRDTSQVTMNVRPPLQVKAHALDSVVCEGNSVQLRAEGKGGRPGEYRYTWPGAGKEGRTIRKHIEQSGRQWVTLEDGCTGTAAMDSVYIATRTTPEAEFTMKPNDTVFVDDTVQFVNNTRSYHELRWDIGGKAMPGKRDSFSSIFSDTGIFEVILRVRSDNGCRDTAMGSVYVENTFRVFIPNAFSPNGDGINDQWRVKGLGIEAYRLEVYNRWGQKLYATTQEREGLWNGKHEGSKVPQGAYLYQLEVEDKTGMEHFYEGEVHVIR